MIVIGLVAPAYSQGKAKTGPDPSTIRDAELEKDSLHNLEVARHYFKLKKAYQAALNRCEEIDAGNFLENVDLHVHVPAGAVPKDGPSAGVTMYTALVSLLTGIRVRHDTAMTGEITLRGKVLPVGGIKEKVLAAHRAGIKRVILPERCTADLDEVPQEVRDELEFVPVTKMDEVLYIAGASSLRLAETGGRQKTKVVMPNDMLANEKQAAKHKTAEELRADARVYFSRLVSGYPNSSFLTQAKTQLEALGGPVEPAATNP